ncbi:MAG: methylenetetrahydrofolate reductase [Desulfobacterales bacterium]|nr:MAG: methylenetetrahydrofolate reductase [Desulfobacterales bacterium]UCD88857.1 MAG: methylenetetrahydrofolate reductase [Desulfobacterales bacterium]
MSSLKEKLNNGSFVLTGEIGPPKGTDIEKHLEKAELIKDKVVAVNVTDLQSAILRAGSLATCHLLQQRGIEPVYQLTCRDRNRLALQSDLLSAWILGIKNVLCLTGDHTSLGDHPEAKPVFDFDSVHLLKASSILNSGKDLTGHDLDGSPNFFQGAVVSPGADPIEPQIIKMKKKVAAGAKFFQTQAVFDVEQFGEFVNKVNGLQVPIIAGIVILKSAGMASYMNEKVAGINVPDGLIKEMKNTEKSDIKKKAVEIAARLTRQVKPFCQGVHLMTLGWEELIPDIIEQAEIS